MKTLDLFDSNEKRNTARKYINEIQIQSINDVECNKAISQIELNVNEVEKVIKYLIL